jgi:hypothetical protein
MPFAESSGTLGRSFEPGMKKDEKIITAKTKRSRMTQKNILGSCQDAVGNMPLRVAMMNKDRIQSVTTEKATDYHGYNNE